MRGHSLLGSLVFALVTALGSIPWMMTAGRLLGGPPALGIYCLVAMVLYVVCIAESWSRGVTIGALAGGLALLVGMLTPMPAGAVVGGGLILAIARSGFLYRGKPARVLVVEGLLVGGGLLFARAPAEGSLLATALAIWSFFLVQSLFFLIGGMRKRRSEEVAGDPFERARQQALALMDEPAV